MTVNLVLFFTQGVSLQTWSRNGSLEREIALYLCLQKMDIRVSFITYGNKTDLQFREQLQGIRILCNRWNLPVHWYARLLPLLHADALFHANVVKTNQTRGAEVALRAAKIWHKPLIARCGYMWSDFVKKSGNLTELITAQHVEKNVFSQSRKIAVTSQTMQDFIVDHYGIAPEKIHVVPNFVLTDLFSPQEKKVVENRVCFVGRLVEQKNLFSLIEACAGLDVDLAFIGEGHLRAELQEKANELGVRLTIHNNIPHHQLSSMINESAVFALVSLYEGHPKVLLEAMSCGVAVLGADSPGIREQLVHGETGWLCGADPASIRTAIRHLLANPGLRHELGLNARKMIAENYSLKHIVNQELELIEEATTL